MLRYWKQRLDDKELQFPSGRPSVPSAGGGEEAGLCLLSQAPPQAGMQTVNEPPRASPGGCRQAAGMSAATAAGSAACAMGLCHGASQSGSN